MRILILNWRSIKDPLEGGAERATFEFAKRWVRSHGAHVYWLSPRYNSTVSEEEIEGVTFVYIGKPLTRNILSLLVNFPFFYFGVVWKYFTRFRRNIDVVIDQVHGIPYMTPLYVREKKVVYIHEVAGAIWKLMYPLPIVLVGYLCEWMMFIVYRVLGIKFIANSPSTYADLLAKLKLHPQNIQTVYYGVTAPVLRVVPEKAQGLTVIYLNRLVRMKGIERGLEVFKLVLEKVPQARFKIVGSGEEGFVNGLKRKCVDLGIARSVDFVGFIDGQEKYDLLAQAHVLMNPSYLEGWGLVNIEANRMGTPVVAFDVRGCRDSVSPGVSGLLSPDNDLQDMANNIITLGKDIRMRKTAQDYALQFDWDIQAKKFYDELQD